MMFFCSHAHVWIAQSQPFQKLTVTKRGHWHVKKHRMAQKGHKIKQKNKYWLNCPTSLWICPMTIKRMHLRAQWAHRLHTKETYTGGFSSQFDATNPGVSLTLFPEHNPLPAFNWDQKLRLTGITLASAHAQTKRTKDVQKSSSFFAWQASRKKTDLVRILFFLRNIVLWDVRPVVFVCNFSFMVGNFFKKKAYIICFHDFRKN